MLPKITGTLFVRVPMIRARLVMASPCFGKLPFLNSTSFTRGASHAQVGGKNTHKHTENIVELPHAICSSSCMGLIPTWH